MLTDLDLLGFLRININQIYAKKAQGHPKLKNNY